MKKLNSSYIPITKHLANAAATGALEQLAATGGAALGGGGASISVDSEENRPNSAATGTLYYNTTEDTLQVYTSTGWLNLGVPPVSITFSTPIYYGIPWPIVITGDGFGTSAVVRFSYGGSTSDVNTTPDSSNQITIIPPSAVYNQSAGASVAISVITGGRISAAYNTTIAYRPTGGNVSVTGGYIYHTFNVSDDFITTSTFTSDVDYLIVAGGGGGGTRHAGAGGAGGYLSSNISLSSSTTYPIVVGSGGAAATNGSASTAFGLTAVGGGKGGNNGIAGSPGGSGGGGSNNAPGGAGTPGQGNSGGPAPPGAYGGGGGGAGAAGGTGSSSLLGLGGNGLEWKSLGTFYAGGGGGGRDAGTAYISNGTSTTGGGGRGSGQSATPGEPGAVNTGGGGGGGGATGPASSPGGSGGPGIVILRYQL